MKWTLLLSLLIAIFLRFIELTIEKMLFELWYWMEFDIFLPNDLSFACKIVFPWSSADSNAPVRYLQSQL